MCLSTTLFVAFFVKLSFRQAERKIKEMEFETAQLRNKLTMVDKKLENGTSTFSLLFYLYLYTFFNAFMSAKVYRFSCVKSQTLVR